MNQLETINVFSTIDLAKPKPFDGLKSHTWGVTLNLEKQLKNNRCDRTHFWARGYMAISSGNITDEMIQKYIEEQEGEPVDHGQFPIDSGL